MKRWLSFTRPRERERTPTPKRLGRCAVQNPVARQDCQQEPAAASFQRLGLAFAGRWLFALGTGKPLATCEMIAPSANSGPLGRTTGGSTCYALGKMVRGAERSQALVQDSALPVIVCACTLTRPRNFSTRSPMARLCARQSGSCSEASPKARHICASGFQVSQDPAATVQVSQSLGQSATRPELCVRHTVIEQGVHPPGSIRRLTSSPTKCCHLHGQLRMPV